MTPRSAGRALSRGPSRRSARGFGRPRPAGRPDSNQQRFRPDRLHPGRKRRRRHLSLRRRIPPRLGRRLDRRRRRALDRAHPAHSQRRRQAGYTGHTAWRTILRRRAFPKRFSAGSPICGSASAPISIRPPAAGGLDRQCRRFGRGRLARRRQERARFLG